MKQEQELQHQLLLQSYQAQRQKLAEAHEKQLAQRLKVMQSGQNSIWIKIHLFHIKEFNKAKYEADQTASSVLTHPETKWVKAINSGRKCSLWPTIRTYGWMDGCAPIASIYPQIRCTNMKWDAGELAYAQNHSLMYCLWNLTQESCSCEVWF